MSSQTVIFPGLEAIRHAESRIRPFIRETALERAPSLEAELGSVWLKLENQQLTGSFKIRGAMNRVLSMNEDERTRGIITASSGNHGLAIAYAAQQHGVSAIIYVPKNTDQGKLDQLLKFGADVRQMGADCGETEVYAMEQAARSDRIFISAYNDTDIISGQGTVGFEIWKQLADVDAVFVPVGGGGLISGIGAYLKAVKPEIEIIGVSPINSPALMDEVLGVESEHRIIKESLSDGTAGSIDKKSITIDFCRAVVKEWILVEEREIEICMRLLFDEYRVVSEGAGVLATAGFIKENKRFQNKNCVLLVCGGNIFMPRFREIVEL